MEHRNSSHQYLLESRPECVEDGMEKNHVCVETQGKRPLMQLISQWYLLVLCLVFPIAITFSMVFWLNGKSFAVDGTPDPNARLTQSDVTTLISVALVMARTVCTTWQALAAWRCVFILLEKDGLSLSEASHLASWRLPTFTNFRPPPSHGTRDARVRTIAVLVLILSWPAQFVNPIASGSVSWIPSNVYETAPIPISLGTPSASHPWSWYSSYANVREQMVKRSAGRASLAATTSGNTNEIALVPPAQRMVMDLGSSPNTTAVKNVTVPIFKIEEFQWVTGDMELPKGILRAIQDYRSGYLNISRDGAPLAQTVEGTAALLKDSAWKAPDPKALPPAQIFSGTKYAAIYVS